MTRRALLVIAKRPEPGATKTRLCPPLTGDEAARLYTAFLRDTLTIVRAVPGVARFVLFTPADARGYFTALAPDFGLIEQRGTTLGERLDHALQECLAAGFERAAVVDSDSPTLPPAAIAAAFDALDRAEAAFGPCADGGYYLVAARRPIPRLLREVRMSTPTVLAETLTLAAAESIRVALTPPWYDVDSAAELARLLAELAELPADIAPHTRAALATLGQSPAVQAPMP